MAEVIGYGETAIAEAARPEVGEAGFTIMSVAALLATAGGTNATLYATSNLTGMLARQRIFPEFLGTSSRFGANAGLVITTALVIVVANFVDLSAIASVGSAIALMVFVLVGVAGWRLRTSTGSNSALVLLTIALTVFVLLFFAVDTLRNAPRTFVAIAAIAALSIVLDAVTRRSYRGRTTEPAPESSPR